jgi:osmoprotectant transport system substrate-binding protein
MSTKKLGQWAAVALGAILLVAGCGQSTSNTTSHSPSKGTITIGAFNFAESDILAYIYGGALQHDGYNVVYRSNLGDRQVVAPALQRGDIDLYAGYTASDLEYYDHQSQQATSSSQSNDQKLQSYLKPLGLTSSEPSGARDENAFAVTSATASRYHLKKVSDLAPMAGQITFGGPPNCPGRSDCLGGLEQVYKLHFKGDFQKLDSDGPLTYAALQQGSIQLAVVFSSDAQIASRGLVVLQDDRHIVNADAVVPIARAKALTPEVASALNGVSAKLTTADLTALNKQVVVDKDDPQQAAARWLASHGY